MPQDAANRRSGFALGLSAYAAWGVMPLYFRALAGVGPTEIVAHRILWSLLFLGVLATAFRKWPTVRAVLAAPRLAAMLALTAVLIAVNWLVYVYAVISGHVLEGSLGYYLNPLVNVLLGVAVLKERLSAVQKGAVALAAVGVALLALRSGGAIWISLTLAASFALYGFFRKIIPVDALEGLSVETIFLAPVALGWILWLQHVGTGAFLQHRTTDVLLVLSGLFTTVPLLLFTAAAKKLPYSTLGFLQYAAPSLQFLLAVAVFHEPLTVAHVLCFAAIWISLALFVVEGFRLGRAGRASAAAA
jgi:chloramphenicol-sensitive protein RarD